MEPVAVNRFTITKSLFYEGMLSVTKERLAPFTKKVLMVLAGLWAVLAAVTWFSNASPSYAFVELAVIAAVGVWLCVYIPRNRAKRAWQAMEEKSGGDLERATRFFPDCLEIENGGETTAIRYENVRQSLSTEHLLVLVCADGVGVLIARDGFITGDMDTVQALIGEKAEKNQ